MVERSINPAERTHTHARNLKVVRVGGEYAELERY